MIFSTLSYRGIAAKLAQLSTQELGAIENSQFPDGEHYRRILTPVIDRDIWLVGGTVSDSDTLELYDLACAIVKYGARSLTLIIPYFGYSTMERETKLGEVLPAKTRARLFSVIPQAPFGNRIVLIDPHTPGLPHYFEMNLRHIQLSCQSALILYALKWLGSDLILAAPDAGRAKDVELYAHKHSLGSCYVLKSRTAGDKTEVKAVFGDVKDKTVLLFDDMIRSGTTLQAAAKSLLEHGAKEIFAMATHGVFPKGAVEKLRTSKVIQGILVTDTHPRASLEGGIDKNDPFLHVISSAEIIFEGLKTQKIGVRPIE